MTDIITSVSRKISNSEVTTFLSCKQQYVFAFMRNLAPKKTPTPLARGTLGHLAFEYYVEARLSGADHEQSMKAADKAFTEALKGGLDVDIVLETKGLFVRYQAFHMGWPDWELLGTEESLELPITDEIIIPMRYDLLIREKSSGRTMLVDFKFTYDFWSEDEHALNGQFPKYILIMNKNGIKVDGAMLEQIRTRTLGKEKSADHKNLWKRTMYYPTRVKQRNTLKQHIAASLEITRFRNLSPEDQEAETIPVLAKHGACKYCNFKELCASKLDGGDIEPFIATAFVQNTYGYNQTTEPMEDLL